MTGIGEMSYGQAQLKEKLRDDELAALKVSAAKELEEIELKKRKKKMAKDKQSESGVNRHKRMAMGEKIELKKGGIAEKKKTETKKKK